ncbi:hypothetical protein P5V34_17000 [Mycobacteroides abscessus subsp. abscessus]|uniref:hypothetical protein n=1 Tax=Mycobacteroides abscessus TaxID=36809 RepID=UPI00266D34F0|nr:hypothetical protein [Mycobacteroides abscessus]MDO3015669.1 hypothetical protein [Mycobacteroides abscessus subsp. abscessus]
MTAMRTATSHSRHVTAVVLAALYALLLLSAVGLTVVGQPHEWTPSPPTIDARTVSVGPGSAVGIGPHEPAGVRP